MAIRRTWWVKLRRAEKHLAEFETEFDRLRSTEQPYDVTTEIESAENGDWLIVRGNLRPFGGGDDMAAVVGDIVTNTRDALDHIHTALTGRDDTHFPIVTDDIWKPDPDPRTRKDRNKSKRDSFKKNTKGMTLGALALVSRLQPCKRDPDHPELDQLALLQRLSDADKHRTLRIASKWMCNPRTTLTIPPHDPLTYENRGMRGRDGAVIATFPGRPPADFQVEASGGIEVALQEADGRQWQWELPDTLVLLVANIKRSVVTPLDAFIM